MATPKQIRCLEQKGFQHVGTWPFESAKKLIDRIAGNGWRVPYDLSPASYKPEPAAQAANDYGFFGGY